MRMPSVVRLRFGALLPALSLVVFLGLLGSAQAQEEKREGRGRKGPDLKGLQDRRSNEQGSSEQVKQLQEEVRQLHMKLREAYSASKRDTQGPREHKGPPHRGMTGKSGTEHASAWHHKGGMGKHEHGSQMAHHGERGAHHGHMGKHEHGGQMAHHGERGEHHRHAGHHGGRGWQHAQHGQASARHGHRGAHHGYHHKGHGGRASVATRHGGRSGYSHSGDVNRRLDQLQREVAQIRHELQQRRR
jgi:hypothetical protein